MLEKLRYRVAKRKADRTKAKTTPRKKKAALLLILALGAGFLLGLLLEKALLVFFLPLAVAFFLLFQKAEKSGEEKTELRKFHRDFYLFLSMERDGRVALTKALEEMDISESKDKVVSDIEAGRLQASSFMPDRTFQSREIADRIVYLCRKDEILAEDVEAFGRCLRSREGNSLETFDFLPLALVLLLVLLSLSYLQGGILP